MPTLSIPKESELHKKLIKRIESRVSMGLKAQEKQHDRWNRAERLTLAYVPESETDSKRRAAREAEGRPAYTTIQIPYSYALLMSAHTYWTSVFFARTPIHQYSGRHGEGEMQVQALEALIGYQVEVGGFMGPYYIWLYDAGKYGHGILGSYWDVEKIHYGQLVEYEGNLYQATIELEGYRGNRVYNVAPFDFIHDPRYPLSQFQQGEFCAARRRVGWNNIVRRKDAKYYNDNTKHLKEHAGKKPDSTNDSALERPDFTQEYIMDGDKDSDRHPAGVVLWEVYVDLIPKEWGLGDSGFPQKWCFTITEDCALIIGACPLGLIHNKFPFSVLESEVEAYGLFNRGIPEIMEPIQNVMDWLINTHFYNVRAALNNQFIVDPSKLVLKDAANADAGFIWRLRPEAFGTDINKIFKQIPVNDVTRGHLGDFQAMLGIGQRTLGINDQIMGALDQSSRKTATEVRSSTGFGVNRLKTVSEYMSATGFAPHSQQLVQTSQQMYDVQGKLRIVGDLAQDAGPQFLSVTPDSISGFFDFVPVDGTMPVDRMAQATLWKEIFAGLRNMPPQIAAGYDWAKMFGWMATLGGLKNIHQFKVKVVPDGMIQGGVQSGNLIPQPMHQLPSPGGSGVSPGNAASNNAGLNQYGAQG